MRSNSSVGGSKPALTIFVVTALALLASVASEIGRLILKGQDYAYSYFNDIHYYTAMATRLWQTPLDVRTEIAKLDFLIAPADFSNHYSSDSLTAGYLHAENGLSHQPPYVYRVFGPTIAGLLHEAGMPLNIAFLLVYSLGAVLLAVFAYGLISRDWRPSVAAAVVAGGATIAALATSSPGYPDMSFLGFAMVAVWAASRHRPWLFAVMGFLAVTSRETGIVLVVPWVAYAWAQRSSWRRMTLPLVGPAVAFIAARLVVEVPNPSIDYMRLLSSLGTVGTLSIGLCALVTIGLITPRIARAFYPDGQPRLAAAEIVIWFAGTGIALLGMLLATNTTRMALLGLALFVAPSGWLAARSHWWLAASAFATVGYATADTLANRADARFGNWPWVATAVVVVLAQAVALRRDRQSASS